VTLFLPNSQSDSSILGEIKEVLNEIKKYRACKLPENIQEIVHSVANNPEVSEKVLNKLKVELPLSHKRYFKIHVIFWSINLVYVLLSFIFEFLPIKQYYANELPALVLVAALTIFILNYFAWRKEFRESYIADFLIRTLEFGLKYKMARENDELRDGLAQMIQRTAVRYKAIYKQSDSSFFFASQVRRRARDCQNNIMTLIPGLITAEQPEIDSLNENLARLLIRTQTGYWYQTDDIAKEGMPMKRSDTIRISLTSLIKDRAIQVAFIALIATVTGAVVSLIQR